MPSVDGFDVSRSIRHHLVAGLVVGVVLLGGAGAWASVATLSGAVVASGHFVVDSYVKKVQHPTGGVVGEILVHEGDVVKAGDILMRLDSTQTRANLAIVTKRLDELTARQARLEAERDDLAEIVFPTSLLARAQNVDVASAIHSETRLFAFRKQSRDGKKAQLAERVVQFRHEIEGLKAQETAYADGMTVLNNEIASLNALRQQGVVSDQRLNSLKTQAATFGGEWGEKIAYQAQAAGKISETRLQILQIDQDQKAEVGSELADVQAQIGEYVERKISAEDSLKRIDITAPQSGTVHQLTVHTVGGVISPAETIMSIVPESDELTLEVQIAPKDIDQISLGHEAMLRMSAFNQRTTPQLKAHVTRIAADLNTNERTGTSSYVVRLTVAELELTKLKGLRLVSGMPAEAMIKTEDRTALSYLLKPLSDQITRAFREE
ncbi:HlyD family type I secretion periplasmic adaptor subunit [Agrobacterium rosae]|uniref:Membrane fusion protein (MFP) family protein n=1 Tax=Agrobacterium rosae TaxID=1972867 RepID=A0AAE5RYW8_9HYPH|nr:HlyD family type I secretion periplasmic adaptor subunit [Agrobacterium rosae]KAA3511500.1 HlyD family type I secretion periplasmic adaptor subunit [Agrobacterium rosae]KAA3519077.1 HlyD family type I secretion periplasmic adaptor subunit [Agrobacterium rosae]MCM2435305.1 HlyD family type I secretion periplasmic adaptor subunit [Agrobacterium rosae]MDX8332175.1 HlyD family type I secretion periplasmic adaptor subunit [Agrobacterium rosae]MQB49181.1 HlyD family type I secretion periplasmic a